MNDDVVITSLKTKKRVRSIFSDKQKIKSSKLHKKVQQQSSDSDEMLKPKEENELKEEKTYRFEVDIKAMTSGDKYPEIFFSDLVGEEEKDKDNQLDPGEELERLALHFENKYGDNKKKRVTDVQLDHGYDTSDPFVDDSEAYDEVIPDELDTQFGGFYINFGDLMFKKVEPEPQNSETEFKSKKRKREDDDKADENKHKISKVKSLRSRIRRELHIKTKPAIEDESEESEESDSSEKKDKEKSSDETSQTTSCSELENKTKSLEKDVKMIKEVKKITVVKLRDRKVPVIIENIKRTVSENKPFDKSKLHLLHNLLYSLEVEVRRSRKIARKSIYEKLSEDLCIDRLVLKKAGLNALTKQNSENLAKNWAPLKAIVEETMPECIKEYTKKKTEYEEILSSLPEDHDDELVKPKAPMRTFAWSDEIRALFGAIISTKYYQIKLLRTKSEEQEDLLKRYLNTLCEAMWPIGWMNLPTLIKEAKPFCPILNKHGKTVSKLLSVKTMSKSKTFKSDNKSKITSKLLKNAISNQISKLDEITKPSLSTISSITKNKDNKIIHCVDLSSNDSPVLTKPDKPSIIRQSSTPLHKQSTTTVPKNSTITIPLMNSTTTIPKNIMTTVPKNGTTSVPKNSTIIIPKTIMTTVPKNSTTTVPKNVTTTVPKNSTTTVPKNVTTTVPKNSTTTVPKNVTTTVPKNSTTTIPKNNTTTKKIGEISSTSKTVPKTSNTQSSSKPNTPKCNTSHPVLQLSHAKPQPRSTKLDSTSCSTITDLALKKQIMDKLSAIHGIEVLKSVQNSPMFDEMIKQALVTSGVNQQKLHRLNISSGASSCPIVIDDEPLLSPQNTPSSTAPRSTITCSTAAASHPTAATLLSTTTTPQIAATYPGPTTSCSTPHVPAPRSITGSPSSCPTTPVITTPQQPTRPIKPPKSITTKSQAMIIHNIQSIITKPSNILSTSLIKSPSLLSTSLIKPSNPLNTSLIKPSSKPLSAILSEHSDIQITTLKSLSDAVSKLKTHDKTL